MDALYPHTITFWHKGPEVGGIATWERVSIQGRIEESSGGRPGEGGTVRESSLLVIAPGRVAVSKGDRMAIGDVPGADPRTMQGTWTVENVGYIRIGMNIHHTEVTCA